MAKMKNFLMEVEEYFYDCLDSEGLTNDQALAYVETKFGSMGKDHCKELLKQFNEPDVGIPTPDDWR